MATITPAGASAAVWPAPRITRRRSGPTLRTTALVAGSGYGAELGPIEHYLNPQKISGVCGRLMCCLSFEYAHYREAKRCLPKVGSHIETEQGPGRITQINVLREEVVVALDDGRMVELPAAAVARHRPGCPHMGPEEAGGAEGAGGAESPASEAAGPKES